jgi:hypothetical protein
MEQSMTRKGRKRQAGPREAAGRLVRTSAEPDKGYSPAAIKRLADCAIAGVADAAYGTSLGRLYLEGRLSAAQFAAGQRFDRLTRRYLQAIAAPRPDPRSIGLGDGPRSADIDPESQAGREQMADHRATIAAMGEARAVLSGSGKGAEAAVRALCEAGELPAGWSGHSALAAGLSGLAAHWHLERKARSRVL